MWDLAERGHRSPSHTTNRDEGHSRLYVSLYFSVNIMGRGKRVSVVRCRIFPRTSGSAEREKKGGGNTPLSQKDENRCRGGERGAMPSAGCGSRRGGQK